MEKLSEYVGRLTETLSLDTCNSLLHSIDRSKNNEFSSSLLEDDLEMLAGIQRNLFVSYRADFMPNINFSEDGNAYTLELEPLIVTSSEGELINPGGSNRSQRFVAFLFIIGKASTHSQITFPGQQVVTKVEQGDVFVFPAYMNHRYILSVDQGDSLQAILLYACMS